MKIAPSLLACDFSNMGGEIIRVEKSGADMVHLDIMDGHFVPNISFGYMVVKALRKYVSIPFDVHLMVSDPYYYCESFAKSGADIITFHVESDCDVAKTIEKIHSYGIKAGISIKPDTPDEVVANYIKNIELVLVMTVEPGFGGQSFMYNQVEKIKQIREMIDEENPNVLLEVDGGINEETAKTCREIGVDVCVAGTSVFKSEDMAMAINKLRN